MIALPSIAVLALLSVSAFAAREASPGSVCTAARVPDGLSAKLATYRSNDLWQTVTWARFTDQKSLEIELVYPATGLERKFTYSASFKIQFVVSQELDVAKNRSTLVVAGVSDKGEAIIERWVQEPKRFQVPNTPLAYTLSRTLVYSGISLGTIDAIQVEPSGKYLVVAHSNPDPHLSQIDLSPGFKTTPLLAPNYEVLLREGIIAIKRAQHETEGLLWSLYLNTSIFRGTDWAIILRDLNGDDELDDWVSHTYEYMRAYYPTPFSQSPWVDDFVTRR